MDLECDNRKFQSKEEAQDFNKILIKEKVATNYEFKTQLKILQKPKPMNTIDLLSTAAE